jgi:hypothetical protein
MSVFSTAYWIKKGYSEDEAKYQIAIRRPNNILYYTNKGHSEDEAKMLVANRQKAGGEKRKHLSDAEKRKLSPRCIEYWIAKGMSQEEAQLSLADFQTHFSKEKCINKYGKEKGLQVWGDRQLQWQQTLKSKTSEEIKEINTKKNRWSKLSENESILLKERISSSVKNSVSKRPKEVTKKIFDKIVKTKADLGLCLQPDLQSEFEQYKRKVLAETKRNELSLLENYEKRGRTNYHLDHMYSIWQGFKDNTPPNITGHICNLKMIPHKENISKHTDCSITLAHLKQLINNYNDNT